MCLTSESSAAITAIPRSISHNPQWRVATGRLLVGGYRAHLRANTPEQAEEALAIVYGPGHHTGAGLSA